jgi:hypothetical protein
MSDRMESNPPSKSNSPFGPEWAPADRFRVGAWNRGAAQ